MRQLRRPRQKVFQALETGPLPRSTRLCPCSRLEDVETLELPGGAPALPEPAPLVRRGRYVYPAGTCTKLGL